MNEIEKKVYTTICAICDLEKDCNINDEIKTNSFTLKKVSKDEFVICTHGEFKKELDYFLRKGSSSLTDGGIQYSSVGGQEKAVYDGLKSFTFSKYTFHETLDENQFKQITKN